ncbi:MAG: SDR family NAD(P)-dependent oxidoreductase [Chloroflexota bacterium]
MNLQERVVAITGATGGLGSYVTLRLAKLGAKLGLFSSSQENLDHLIESLSLPGDRYLTLAGDLRTSSAAQTAAEATLEKFSRADILLHFVGGWTGGSPLLETSSDHLNYMLEQHVWSTFYIIQAFLPLMVSQRWGRVIAISSPLAGLPGANNALYAAAKAAQETLILSLASEIANSGVTANIIRVRAIDVKNLKEEKPTPAQASWATPEEITAAILYLCSETASLINGARIPLHGAP